MVVKIILSIPIIASIFYLICLALEHDKCPNPNLTPEAKRYEDLTGIISYLAILSLLGMVWSS